MALRPPTALGVAALAAVVLLTTRAVAGVEGDPAQQLFAQGVEAARQDRWEEARVAFEGAYALSARPVILFNLAGAQSRTGHLIEAVRSYRALSGDAAKDDAPIRDAAASVLVTMQVRVPQIQLRTAGLSARDVVEIDGIVVAREHLRNPQQANPGRHTVVVRRGGAARARISFSLGEGETHEVSLPAALTTRLETTSVPLALALRTADDASPPAARSGRPWWTSPWVWGALATAAGAAAAVLAVTSYDGPELYSGTVPPGIIHVE
jgi:hypothetical protein